MTVTVSHKPSFPLPLFDSLPDAAADYLQSDLLGRVGHCAPFCAAEGPTEGASAVDPHGHGPICESIIAMTATGTDEHGAPAEFLGNLVSHYLNGVYRRDDVDGLPDAHNRGYVCVSTETRGADGQPQTSLTYLSAGEARSMAAGLVYLAEQLERPIQPIGTTRSRRSPVELH